MGAVMSYNIDTWKLKKLDYLRIPIQFLFPNRYKDWNPEIEIIEDGYIKLIFMETVEIDGREIGDVLCVEKIEFYGEDSGTLMNLILEPALKNSTGELIASCVWEGGDTINQLRVKDGNVEWVDIEI